MNAGRELDTLIAVKVMGWTRIEGGNPEIEHAGGIWRTPAGPRMLLPFSADISRAWQVHQAMCGRLFSVRRRYFDALQAQATIQGGGLVSWPDVLVVLAAVMPEAICHAALAALEATE